MSAQQLLTFLFDAIALSFTTIAAIDLSQKIIKLYRQVFIAPQQPTSTISQAQALPQLPDPWLLSVEDTADPADRCLQQQPKPVLLLAQAKAIAPYRSRRVGEAQSLGQCRGKLEELLVGIDIDKLQMRPARKLAKLLGIPQKINGKDQKLAFLRGQIKSKLQETRSLQPEVIAAVREELIAC